MSLLTFGLGIQGTIGGGDQALEVVMEEDAPIVVEQEFLDIELQEADFNVKIVQKETKIINE